MENSELKQVKEEVRGMFPNTHFPDVEKLPLLFGRRNPTLFQDKFVLADVSTTPPTPYAVCTDEYKLLPHEEAVWQVKTMLKDCPWGEPQISINLIDNGARMFSKFTFPDCKLEVRKNDSIAPEIRVLNSIDLSKKFTLTLSALRLLCTNGMIGRTTLEKISKLHLQDLDTVVLISKALDKLGDLSEDVKLWREYAKIQLNPAEFDVLWAELPFGTRQKEALLTMPLLNEPEVPSIQAALKTGSVNLWNLNSVVSQFTTHNVENPFRRHEMDEKIAERVFAASGLAEAA